MIRVTLFDDQEGDGSSPEDVQAKKTKRRRRKIAPKQGAVDQVRERDLFLPVPTKQSGYIGSVSDCGTRCQKCDADEYDVADEHGNVLYVDCAFCGARLAIAKPIGFRFVRIGTGQLAGMTVAQAAATNRKIVEHLAKTNPEIRAELDRISGATIADNPGSV